MYGYWTIMQRALQNRKYTIIVSSMKDITFSCRIIVNSNNVISVREKINFFKKVFGINYSLFCKVD